MVLLHTTNGADKMVEMKMSDIKKAREILNSAPVTAEGRSYYDASQDIIILNDATKMTHINDVKLAMSRIGASK